jgi:hypothetical protein
MKQEVHHVVPDHVVSVPGSHKGYLVVNCISGHEQWPVHAAVGVSTEGGRILEEEGYIGELPDVDVLFDVMKIVVMPVRREGVGIEDKKKDGDEKDRKENGFLLKGATKC